MYCFRDSCFSGHLVSYPFVSFHHKLWFFFLWHSLELLTPCGFIVSPNKGVLVNFYEVIGATDDSFTLSDGSSVPISRRKRKEVMAAYTLFRFQKLRSEVQP